MGLHGTDYYVRRVEELEAKVKKLESKLNLFKILGKSLLYLKEIFSNFIDLSNFKVLNSWSLISFKFSWPNIFKKLLADGIAFLKFIERL